MKINLTLSDEFKIVAKSVQKANSFLSQQFLAKEAETLDHQITSDMAKRKEDTSSARFPLEAQPKPNEYHMDLGPVPQPEPGVNEGAARPDNESMKAMEPPRGDDPEKPDPEPVVKPKNRRRRIDSFRN